MRIRDAIGKPAIFHPGSSIDESTFELFLSGINASFFASRSDSSISIVRYLLVEGKIGKIPIVDYDRIVLDRDPPGPVLYLVEGKLTRKGLRVDDVGRFLGQIAGQLPLGKDEPNPELGVVRFFDEAQVVERRHEDAHQRRPGAYPGLSSVEGERRATQRKQHKR